MAVAASVEPMPVGLAGGSRDGIDATQRGEGSLRMETVRVTPGSNEEGSRRVWPYAEAIHQGWGCRPCESLDLGLQVLYLIAELAVATGKGAKGISGRRGGILQTTGPEALAPGDKSSSGETTEVLTELGRGRDDQGRGKCKRGIPHVTEFEGRHNVRPLDTADQMARMVQGADGKQLRYQDLAAA